MNKPVMVHFAAHNQVYELRAMAIEYLEQPRREGSWDNRLLCSEAFWRYSLDTETPRSLSTAFGFSFCQFSPCFQSRFDSNLLDELTIILFLLQNIYC